MRQLSNKMSKNTKIQRLKKPKVKRIKGSKVQKYKRSKGSNDQRSKERIKGPKVQRSKVPKVQRSKDLMHSSRRGEKTYIAWRLLNIGSNLDCLDSSGYILMEYKL